MAGTAGRLSHSSMPAPARLGSPDRLARRAGCWAAAAPRARRELVGRHAGDDPQRGHARRWRRLAVVRPTTEWNDVRHGSPQLLLGPDAMLQVRRSSALGGSPSAFGRLFLLWLRRARVFSTGQHRPEQLAL